MLEHGAQGTPLVDIGGLPVAGERYVRRGKVYRVSGALVGSADLDALSGLGLKAFVDLRGHDEDRSLLDHWADAARIRYAWLPIDVAGSRDIATAVGHADDAIQAAAALSGLYREIIDGNGAELAGALGVIAAGTPVAFGCAAGKDRTGIAAALLHVLLGVAEKDVVASYAASPPASERLRPLVDEHFGRVAAPPHLDVLLGAEKQTMRAALEHIRTTHGGVESYVRDHGLTSDQIAGLRRELVG